jgi:Flp pilus assembly protein CpaB
VSRRARAGGFLVLALFAAGAAAALADGYGSSVARGYGPLRDVVVVDSGLPAGRRLGQRQVESSLTVRRVPERFIPAGALGSPLEALGLLPRAALPAGSYLLAAELAARPSRPPRSRRLGGGRRAVEIEVTGAGALLAAGSPSTGARVDVVVTGEPRGPGPGRTYVAATAVPLLALRPDGEAEGTGGAAAATLGLRRGEALRLIAAESYARRITLLPEG